MLKYPGPGGPTFEKVFSGFSIVFIVLEIYNFDHRFQQRRGLITNYCNTNYNDSDLNSVNQDSKWNQDLYFEYQYKLLYCQISKIGSSTWINHLSA